ncbi:glycosyltransferase family 4 protein [Bacillus sp. AFS031507]|uniref:glycosyltransferase family 4 protein n=1 Tax=Bacillus sp. AFS031507 TaxID=2033496 RepID=UPI0015D47205|nr:glycosyltransferase family 4 protein [Bacillus sp. AFS031507]
MEKKVLIIRNFASKININSYNLQEIGLGKAFVRKGFNCDVVYYSDNTYDEIIYENNGKKLTVKWTKASKVMSNSIYYSLLKKSRINQYDIIVSTEYNQIMTFLLSLIVPEKVYLYHGPYKNNSKKLFQRVYDLIITPYIRKRIVKIFTKSDLANDYLKSKGFRNIKTIGVGLDIEKLEGNNNEKQTISEKYLNFNNKNLLYVGVLEDRRNIEFLFKVFAKLIKKDPELNLVLVGNGENEDIERYFSLAQKLNINKNILHIKKLQQSELKYFYEKADLFLFPTSYEIFGMVIMESMYFKLPVISTYNGGSQILINSDNGVIIKNLDEAIWVEKIFNTLINTNKIRKLGGNANKQITENFTWDKILEKMFS